jgi:long-chain acyl-CoA synthetase
MSQIDAAPLTLARLPLFAGEQHGGRRAVLVKRDGGWQERSYAEVSGEIERLATGFVGYGIQPGERVCVLADTRPEWSVAAFALWSVGVVVVPIYPTSSPEECEWIAGNSGAVAVIAEDAAQLAKIVAIREALPTLRTIFVVEARDAAEGVVALGDVLASGGEDEELSRRRDAVAPVDPALIIYTSGTTGPPKGCVLTHRNAMSLRPIVVEVKTLLPGDVAYLYLPLAHAFAQMVQFAAFQVGAAIAYYGGDAKQIIPELMEVHPDFLPSVPRIFEKLYALAMTQVPPEEHEDLRRAVQVGVRVHALEARGERVPDELRGPFERADERVFSRVRALFGGHLREALTAGAPIALEVLEFFYAAGVPVMEGYGMTETMAIGTINLADAFRFGTVGRAAPGVEVRIAEHAEILTRGPQVFTGYWGSEAATREVLDEDGWLHTGDLGSLDEDGFLSITGRIKDIIITAGGKNITPQNLENDLKQSPIISQAVMYGDRRPYLVALVALDPEVIIPWARERGLPEDVGALAQHPEVKRLVQEALDRANTRYAQVEQIKRFTILDHDLTQETGELTPTMKVKRNIVYERYADVFDKLYAG